MNPLRDKYGHSVLPWVAPLGLLALWHVLSRSGVITPNLLPAPLEVLSAAVRALRHESLLTHLAVSAWRAGLGLIDIARVYDLRGLSLYTEVILPGALPSVLVGFRFVLGLSWLVMIVAETLGASSGLGYVAATAREFMQMDVLVLPIVLWALLGKAADILARRLERALLPWQPKAQRLTVE